MVRLQQERFIPACAGNSERCPPVTGPGTVHPRVCGEQPQAPEGLEYMPGSSPRVRGTAADGEARRALERFIPACAGNRGRTSPRGLSTPVHPRVCGEQGG